MNFHIKPLIKINNCIRKNSGKKVFIPEISFTESRDLYLAAILPHKIPLDRESVIVCKSWNPGELSIDLFSLSGQKLANLHSGFIEKEKTFLISWDGKDKDQKDFPKGKYKIRWTVNEAYREYPVEIH